MGVVRLNQVPPAPEPEPQPSAPEPRKQSAGLNALADAIMTGVRGLLEARIKKFGASIWREMDEVQTDHKMLAAQMIALHERMDQLEAQMGVFQLRNRDNAEE